MSASKLLRRSPTHKSIELHVSSWLHPAQTDADLTAWACDPYSKHHELRDRAALALHMGAASVQLKLTRAEWLALAELAAEVAATIPIAPAQEAA